MMNLSTVRYGRGVLVGAVVLAGCGGAASKFEAVGSELDAPSTATTVPALVPYVGDGFSVSLPGPAKVDKQTTQSAAGPIEVTFVIASQGASNAYSVSHNAVPATGFDLDAAATGAATGVQGNLADVRPVTYKGYQGRDFRVTKVKGRATVFGRVLLVKKRAFFVQAVLDGDQSAPPDLYRQVIESLTFS